MTLEPRPTRLDDRILAGVPAPPSSLRARSIAAALRLDPAEVRRVLRGFEHLGRVENRSGWWRRTAP